MEMLVPSYYLVHVFFFEAVAETDASSVQPVNGEGGR